mmetsp:Transcript_23470/g.65154  ORF Transcript_23470/g.65154 Transcript_23470/m.65154 type:complete len:625 (-) Transcript_23470:104-1978(-)
MLPLFSSLPRTMNARWWVLACVAFLFGSQPVISFQTTRPQRNAPPTNGILALGAARRYSEMPATHASYLTTCTPGLSHVLQKELEEIRRSLDDPSSIADIFQSGNAGVTFTATREASLHALCWLRSAHRLLELVATTDGYYGNGNDNRNDDRDRDRNDDLLLYDRHDLHDFVRECVDARELLGDGKGGLLTLSVKTILNNPRQLPKDLSHSHYTALGIKNSLCDVVREMRGDRPSVDVDDPDVPLVAILRGIDEGGGRYGNRNGYANGNANSNSNDGGAAGLSIYRSLHPPGSLHKRGYRSGGPIHKAAMKESMAAGLLLEAGWNDKVRAIMTTGDNDHEHGNAPPSTLTLIDPMAGSGSFVLEACMMAADIAPGLMRIRCGVPHHSAPPVTRWKSGRDPMEDDANTAAWKTILLDATQRAREGIRRMKTDNRRIRIRANDIHPRAVDIAESSLEAAGLAGFVELSNEDCYDLEGAVRGGGDDDSDNDASPKDEFVVATNPPWGVRLTEDIAESWEGLRHFVRDKCPSGTEVYVLSGDKTATAALKLKRDRMIPLQTGDRHLRWIRYTIGQRKKVPQQQRYGEYDREDDWGNNHKNSGQTKKGATARSAPTPRVTAAEEEDSWM